MILLAVVTVLLALAGEEKADDSLKPLCMAFTGDLMAHCTQSSGAREATGGKGYDFAASFDRVRTILTGADAAMGNLETPLDGRVDGYCFPRFSAPVEYADALQGAGLDVLLVANNHALDRGEEGLARTLRAVYERGMAPVGVSPDAAELSLEVSGRKVAVLGYTRFVNLRCRGTPCPLLLNDQDTADAAVARVRELRTRHDVVIVLLHWMSEDRLLPTSKERRLAAALVAAGAQAVIGTHSHVLGPGRCLAGSSIDGALEEVPCGAGGPFDGYVRYSLGNFVHAMKRFPTRLGGIDTVCFAPGPDGTFRVTSARLTPTLSVRNGGRPRSFQAVPLLELEAACQGDAAARKKAGADCDEVQKYRKFLNAHPSLAP